MTWFLFLHIPSFYQTPSYYILRLKSFICFITLQKINMFWMPRSTRVVFCTELLTWPSALPAMRVGRFVEALLRSGHNFPGLPFLPSECQSHFILEISEHVFTCVYWVRTWRTALFSRFFRFFPFLPVSYFCERWLRGLCKFAGAQPHSTKYYSHLQPTCHWIHQFAFATNTNQLTFPSLRIAVKLR